MEPPDGNNDLRGEAGFPKEDRLLKRTDFQQCKLSGITRHTPHFLVSMAPSPTGTARLGVVVTKRLGKAVKRNRVKRLLREYFRLHKGLLPFKDIVIVAKKGASLLTWQQTKAELHRVLVVGVKANARG